MNQFSRYGLATIVVTCLLALIIGLFPGIELKSGFGSDQNLSLEHDVETLERSTDLTSDEVYDLYVGPEAPTRDVKKPPKHWWPQSPFPPRFSQGNHSGYCTVRFDVTPEGQTYNIETLKCSSDQLESATIKSVKKWKYSPKVVDGKAVTRTGIESKIQFDIVDENGKKLPLPDGY